MTAHPRRSKLPVWLRLHAVRNWSTSVPRSKHERSACKVGVCGRLCQFSCKIQHVLAMFPSE
eukprot:11128975-Lingulodinium_polyedra.AAC.1